MIELDFIQNMRDYVNTLGLDYVCKLGYLETSDSLVVYPLPGGRMIAGYYDGIEDKQLNYEFAIKTKSNLKASNTLHSIGRALETADLFVSGNGSYDMDKNIIVSSEPTLITADETGFFLYTMAIQAELTIYKGGKQ